MHIADAAFVPATLRVSAGTTVTWINDDAYQHTVSADDAQQWGTAGSGDDAARWLAQGASWSHAFESAGTYAYRCALHADQRGTVVVT